MWKVTWGTSASTVYVRVKLEVFGDWWLFWQSQGRVPCVQTVRPPFSWVVCYLTVCGQSLSRVWLCHSMDYSLPGSSVHGISQARMLEWVATPSSRGSSQPGIEPVSLVPPVLSGGFFTIVPPGKSIINRILQGRILESVAIPFSRGSSWLGDRTRVSCASYIAGRFFTIWATKPNGQGNFKKLSNNCDSKFFPVDCQVSV